MSKAGVSKAQLEVWEWKAEAWKEVEQLDLEAAFRKRLADSLKTVKRLGFQFTTTDRVRSSNSHRNRGSSST